MKAQEAYKKTERRITEIEKETLEEVLYTIERGISLGNYYVMWEPQDLSVVSYAKKALTDLGYGFKLNKTPYSSSIIE